MWGPPGFGLAISQNWKQLFPTNKNEHNQTTTATSCRGKSSQEVSKYSQVGTRLHADKSTPLTTQPMTHLPAHPDHTRSWRRLCPHWPPALGQQWSCTGEKKDVSLQHKKAKHEVTDGYIRHLHIVNHSPQTIATIINVLCCK